MSRFDSMLAAFNDTLFSEYAISVVYRDALGTETQRNVMFRDELLPHGEFDEVTIREETAVFRIDEGECFVNDTIADDNGTIWRLIQLMDSEALGRVGDSSARDKRRFRLLRLDDHGPGG